MSTDRELIELAAKAAGVTLEWNEKGFPGYWGEWRGLPQWEEWNPLTDDGDALRLAVKLGIAVSCRKGNAQATRQVDQRGWFFEPFDEPAGEEPYAATRRVIVRAAAELGRAMTEVHHD